jgi:hypothetical protein
MNAPFDLELGLRLEASQLMLPWNSNLEDLCRIGSPEVYRHPSAINILWKEEFALGGLPVQVSAMTASGPNVFYLHATEPAASAQAEYAWLLKEASSRLGPPHTSVIDDGYPWSKWLWGEIGVSLRIGERFTEYVSFMVAKGIFRA